MKKYKIKRKNLKEFFGFLTKKKTPAQIQKIVDEDPILQKLQKDFRDLNDKSEEYFDKLKERNPQLYKWAQKNNFAPKD